MVTLIAPRKIVATATTSATLVRGAHTPVDATSGALTMTLPTNAPAGVEISVEKVDAGANAVTVSGTLRGVANSTIPLTSQYEARTFLSEGGGSWRPTSDHRTAASLSATYARARAESIQKPRPATAQVVLTFDDAYTEDWTVVKPILDAKGVKGTFCLLTGGMATSGLSWSQATQLAASGHELVAHSRTHANLAGASAASLVSEVAGSFADILVNTGITAKGFCWPLNSHDAAAREAARSQGVFAIGSGSTGYNVQPFKSYGLARQGIVNGEVLATYTGWVDHAVANNELLIVLVHSGYNLDATQQANLASLIDYIKAAKVPIRTISDALAASGNVFDVGDYFGGTNYTVVGGNGALSSSSLLSSPVIFGPINPLVTAAPSTFTQNAITIQAVQSATGASYPGGTSGVLETINAGNGSSFFVKQIWRNSSDRVYERSGDGSTGWLAWAETTPGLSSLTMGAINSSLATAAPSAFATGVTINSINGPNSTGTPASAAGTLITTKTPDTGWAFQEFQAYAGNSRWRRAQNGATDAWLAWVAYA